MPEACIWPELGSSIKITVLTSLIEVDGLSALPVGVFVIVCGVWLESGDASAECVDVLCLLSPSPGVGYAG